MKDMDFFANFALARTWEGPVLPLWAFAFVE